MTHYVFPHVPCTVQRVSNTLVSATLGVGSVNFWSFTVAWTKGPGGKATRGAARYTDMRVPMPVIGSNSVQCSQFVSCCAAAGAFFSFDERCAMGQSPCVRAVRTRQPQYSAAIQAVVCTCVFCGSDSPHVRRQSSILDRCPVAARVRCHSLSRAFRVRTVALDCGRAREGA